MSNAQCFYPNGDPTLEEDIPCGTGNAVACCPRNWECRPNGLCYLPDQNYYGRYTCTDKNWGVGCPDICTYDHGAAGNEAILECTPGSYCCDTNRPELSGGTDCCRASQERFYINGQTAETYSGPAFFAEPSLLFDPLSPDESPVVTETSIITAPPVVTEIITVTVTPTVSESFPSSILVLDYTSTFEDAETTSAYEGGQSGATIETQTSTEAYLSDEDSSLITLTSDFATPLSRTSLTDESSQSLSASDNFVQATESTSAARTVDSASNARTPAPPSSMSTASSLPIPIPAAVSSPSITREPRFVAGVTIGTLVAFILALFALYIYRRRRQMDSVRYQSAPPKQSGYSEIEQINPGGQYNTRSQSPFPPLTQPYSTHPALNGSARNHTYNPSPYNYTVVPDNDPGPSPSQQPIGTMQYSSAYRPFNPQIPPASYDMQSNWQSPQSVGPYEIHHYGETNGPYRPRYHPHEMNTVSEETGPIASSVRGSIGNLSPAEVRQMGTQHWSRRNSELPS